MANSTAATTAVAKKTGQTGTGAKTKPPTTGQIWPRGNKTQ